MVRCVSGQLVKIRVAERSLVALKRSQTLVSAFGAKPGAALGLAWLFVMLPASHLFLEAAAFDKLPEATYGLLY